MPTELRRHAETRDEREPDERPAVTAPAPGPQPTHASLLQLQQTAGNQAVQRMLAPSKPTLQRMTFLDVLGPFLETNDWTEGKKKARAKEIVDAGEKDQKKADTQAATEVDAAARHEQKIKSGQLIDVDEWVVMKKGLTTDEYRGAVRSFEAWTGDEKEKEKFLKKLPPDKLFLFTDLVAKRPGTAGQTLEKQVETSPNAAKAQQARKELEALKKKTKKSKARLTDPIVALLVWGVAERRSADDVGQEGILGIEQAVDAAKTLVAMGNAAYVDTVLQLDLANDGVGGWDARRVESALILKAVAARKSKYGGGKDEDEAREQVGDFADEIRGEGVEKLTESTSTRDIGGGQGLQQKFTMSCGPTSIQIVRGESDPVYALSVSKDAKHDLDYESDVGKEQAKLLGVDAAPRTVKDRWDAFNTAINGMSPPADDVPRWQALLAWIGGDPHDAALKAEGAGLANGLGFGNAELAEFRKWIKGLQTEPGLTVPMFKKRIRAAKLAGVTNDKYPLKQFDAGKKPVKEKDLAEIWDVLFRGRDILMGVFWTAGGGHYMVLSDARGDPKAAAGTREFLLSDPWEGNSQWITGSDLAAGNFGTAGTGYIDDIYY